MYLDNIPRVLLGFFSLQIALLLWFPLYSTSLEDFGELSSSLQMPELAVGLRLVILDSSVVLRRLLSESSFLKSVFIFTQQGRQCTKSCRRWPLKTMYIQGLQQLLRLASSAERVTAVFSESTEPRGNRKFRKHLVLTWQFKPDLVIIQWDINTQTHTPAHTQQMILTKLKLLH